MKILTTRERESIQAYKLLFAITPGRKTSNIKIVVGRGVYLKAS